MHRRTRTQSAILSGALIGVGSAIAYPAYGQNLLTNGGFENQPVPNAPPDSSTSVPTTDWTIEGNAARANYYDHTTGTGWSIWFQSWQAPATAFQTYTGPVTDGTSYTLSAYWLFEPNYPATGAVVDMEMVWENSSGGTVGSPTVLDIEPGDVVANKTWSQYTVTGMAPSGATQIKAEFDLQSNESNAGGAQSAFVDDASLTGAGTPPVNQWGIPGTGEWQTGGNWLNGTANLGVGADSEFLSAITAPSNVYTDTALTTGTIHFNNSNEYVLDGAGSLTLQVSSGNALVQVDQAVDEINLPTTIASNTTFNVATGATLVVGNPLTVNAGTSVTQTGGGTVTYNSIVDVLSGGASVAFGNSTHANTLEIGTGSSASIQGTGNVVEVSTLSNSGTFDVTKNELLVDYTPGNDPVASIAAELKKGFNNGGWNGTGIISSAAQTTHAGLHYGLGWSDGADKINGHTIVNGLGSGQIEIKYTLVGDANLDGTVNGADFSILAANFGLGYTNWDQGNFLFTPTVNGTDFAGLAANFGQGDNVNAVASVSAADVAALDAFAAANGLPAPSFASVPEPATAGLLLAAGTLGLSKRRRRG
jgi:hypothetical protein